MTIPRVHFESAEPNDPPPRTDDDGECRADNETLRARLGGLQSDLERCRNDSRHWLALADQKGRTVDEMVDELKKCEARNASRDAEVASLQNKRKMMKETLLATQSDLDGKAAEIVDLRAELAEAKASVKAQAKALAKAKADAEASAAKAARTEPEPDELTRSVRGIDDLLARLYGDVIRWQGLSDSGPRGLEGSDEFRAFKSSIAANHQPPLSGSNDTDDDYGRALNYLLAKTWAWIGICEQKRHDLLARAPPYPRRDPVTDRVWARTQQPGNGTVDPFDEFASRGSKRRDQSFVTYSVLYNFVNSAVVARSGEVDAVLGHTQSRKSGRH